MIRKLFLSAALSILFLLPQNVFGQENITSFSSYWKHKVDQFRILPNPKGEICFLGDSITDGGNWTELIGSLRVTNRGISSDTAWGIMKRIDEVTSGQPAKVFLMIGTNDLSRAKTVTEVRDKIAEIIDTIHKDSPKTQIYLESVLPVIDAKTGPYQNKNINPLNEELVKLASSKKATWVNLAPLFKDESGQLKTEFSEDGLHLNGKGYQLWYSQIKQYLK
jgi:lysophospholipase L1-like esterase